MGTRLKRQEIWVITVAALTIASSVLATLWTQGFLFGTQPGRETYQNITFTDAILKCEAESRAQYKSRLQNLALDDLSSRLDHSENLYRIFFNAQVAKSLSDPEAEDFLITCLVSAARGDIAKYEVLQKKEPGPEPIRKNEAGVFGWPIK